MLLRRKEEQNSDGCPNAIAHCCRKHSDAQGSDGPREDKKKADKKEADNFGLTERSCKAPSARSPTGLFARPVWPHSGRWFSETVCLFKL